MRGVMILAVVTGCVSSSPDDEITVRPGEARDDGKADDLAGARAEVKATVATAAIETARDRLGLRRSLAEQRAVWFYDTRGLALLEAGAILRARKVADETDDSTAKLRPLAPDDVDPAWFTEDGFKCELDWTPARASSSCSLTRDQRRGEIDDVSDGERAIDRVFGRAQETFVTQHGPAVAWTDLVALGPIDAEVWTLEADDLPARLTAEHWQLGDEEFLELSLKVGVDDIDAAFAALTAWLAQRDIPLDDGQETKTRRALEILSGAGQ